MSQIKTVAVYRILYGEDFIQESIESILPCVDKVYCVLADRPWGNTTGVHYKGEWIPWPAKFDNVRTAIQVLNSPKIEIIDDYYPTPKGQITHIVNNLILPRCKPIDVVFIEPDHVFDPKQAEHAFLLWELLQHGNGPKSASTKQVELWKEPTWRVPERPYRNSVVFHRVNGQPMGETGFDGAGGELWKLDAYVHNLGFCISPEVMYWKHLTAIAFSKIIGDSVPNEAWLGNKWLSWDPRTNNRDLEISLGYEWAIPYAVPYNPACLPESIRRKFQL